MNVNISVDGNEIKGFDSIPSGSKFTQWTNGYSFLVIDDSKNWIEPYNASKKIILGERNGYLVTITSQDEIIQVSKVFSVNGAYVGGTRTTTDNIGTQFNDPKQIDNRTLYDN